MYSAPLKSKVRESAEELEKIASIKFGQKWSVTNMAAVCNTMGERITRTVWYTDDGRSKTKAYIVSVYDNVFNLLESVFTNVANYVMPTAFAGSKQFKLIKLLMTGIPAANTGLVNLKGSYSDDKDFSKWVDAYIKSINKRTTDAHARLQNYLILGGLLNPRVRENTGIIRSESFGLAISAPIPIGTAFTSPIGTPPGLVPTINISPRPPSTTAPPPPKRNLSQRSLNSSGGGGGGVPGEPIYMNMMEFEGVKTESDSDDKPCKCSMKKLIFYLGF
jgi:hypothetical protein